MYYDHNSPHVWLVCSPPPQTHAFLTSHLTLLSWYLLYLTVTWHHSSLSVPVDDYVKIKILSVSKENFSSKIKIIVCFKEPLIAVLTKGLFMVSGVGWWVSRHLLLATGHHGEFSRDARWESLSLLCFIWSQLFWAFTLKSYGGFYIATSSSAKEEETPRKSNQKLLS